MLSVSGGNRTGFKGSLLPLDSGSPRTFNIFRTVIATNASIHHYSLSVVRCGVLDHRLNTQVNGCPRMAVVSWILCYRYVAVRCPMIRPDPAAWLKQLVDRRTGAE